MFPQTREEFFSGTANEVALADNDVPGNAKFSWLVRTGAFVFIPRSVGRRGAMDLFTIGPHGEAANGSRMKAAEEMDVEIKAGTRRIFAEASSSASWRILSGPSLRNEGLALSFAKTKVSSRT